MNESKVRRNSRGLTLVEMSLAISVTAIIALTMSRYYTAPTNLYNSLNQLSAMAIVRTAADVVANDLREADRLSMPLDTIDPSNAGRVLTGIDWFRIPQINAPSPYRYIKYEFQADPGRPGYGALIRSLNPTTPTDAGATQTTILENQSTPTAAVPVLVLDSPQSSTILIALQATPLGQRTPSLATRRVTIRN